MNYMKICKSKHYNNEFDVIKKMSYADELSS